MQIEQPNNQQIKAPRLIKTIKYPDILQNSLKLSIQQQQPILNKIVTNKYSFYCGYSDGKILQYSLDNYVLQSVYSPYQNTDVIDMQIMDDGIILCCNHTQVTLYNSIKNKSISLKGHQQTLIGVAVHPISPLAVSVSNLIIHHDLRMSKPINVNFVTPPVYGLQYFPDGQYYFLQGQPCRIGKHGWMRTLLNGLGTVSNNSKFLLINQMNTKIRLWDWQKSQIITQLSNISNIQNYQPIYYGLQDGKIRQILFLQDNEKNQRYKIIQPKQNQIWKMLVNKNNKNTNQFLLYQHFSGIIQCYKY